jgi:hypothetical protein
MSKQKATHLKARRPSRAAESHVTPIRIGVEGNKRLGADVPASIYVQVEDRCRERGLTKRQYLLELLRRDGIE